MTTTPQKNYGLREVGSLVDVFDKVPDNHATGTTIETEMTMEF